MEDILKGLCRVVFLKWTEQFIYRNIGDKVRQILWVMSQPYSEIGTLVDHFCL